LLLCLSSPCNCASFFSMRALRSRSAVMKCIDPEEARWSFIGRRASSTPAAAYRSLSAWQPLKRGGMREYLTVCVGGETLVVHRFRVIY
jgi:hypothetical protein